MDVLLEYTPIEISPEIIRLLEPLFTGILKRGCDARRTKGELKCEQRQRLRAYLLEERKRHVKRCKTQKRFNRK